MGRRVSSSPVISAWNPRHRRIILCGGTTKRKSVGLLLAAIVMAGTGCQMAKAPRGVASEGHAGAMMMAPFSVMAASTQRYIAERHKIEIIAAESELQKSWEAMVAFCGTVQCEVLTSSITSRTEESSPSGAIVLRVVPEDLKKVLGYLEKLGKVAEHATEREDKTAAVVDTEAKVKNLTTFRDGLRAMLVRPSAKVSDLVEIQKQLTETQADLDTEVAQRKILANEAEKVAVEISFRVERHRESTGGFAKIWDALRESGAVLGDSTASLITTIVALIPWLILIVPGIWFLRRLWKRWKLHRKRGVPPPISSADITREPLGGGSASR